MTDQELYLSFGYLASPIRETNIEVEMPAERQRSFITQYADWTNNYPLPIQANIAPYYVWEQGANKYGLENRVYFVSNNNLPNCLEKTLEPRKIQNRPGYENWQRRISNNEYIIRLFQAGFVLGPHQDPLRIRDLVPPEYLNEFNAGYAL
jgi:hypothetical protein